MQPDCFGELPLPPNEPDVPAMWFVFFVVTAVLIFEIWAMATGHHTISQWTQKLARKHRWLRILAPTLLGLLIVHLFWKGPLW